MIHLIITSANIPDNYEKRKNQYLKSIEACLKYSDLFDSYTILECFASEVDYLKDYNVFYSSTQNSFLNKGLNEMSHIKAFLQQASLSDNDAIVKLTGRYLVEEPYFFETVKQFSYKIDSIFKSDSDFYVGNGYHTFFYYMKKGLFLDAIESLEFSDINERPIEWDIKDFFLKKEKHLEIDRLGVVAYQGTNSETIFKA